jgi:hypothetical protein
MNILHCFADTGVECEALSAYGDVTRVGIDPEPNPYTDELIKADATEWEPEQEYDLGLFHPPCQRWTPGAQQSGTADEHDNLIPIAREIARQYCDEWIIENVPQAPLHNPVTLNGEMFGLPLHYERCFETSYHVDQPRQQTRLTEPPEKLKEHHATAHYTGSKDLWKSVKGYSHDWPSRTLKRSGIPRAYINYLVRPLL